MTANNSKNSQKILVGADIAPIGKGLVNYTNKIFESSGAEFRVVHVDQANHLPMHAISYVGEFTGIDFSRLAGADQKKSSESQLEEQTRSIIADREVKIAVLNGKPSDEIAQDALSSQSELIVVAPGKTSKDFLPYGLSTSINLMSQSKIPVLAIPQVNLEGTPSKKPTILVCDDMTEASDRAVSYSKHFASMFEESKIVHAHIVRGSENEVEKFGETFLEKMTAGSVPFSSDFASKGFTHEVKSKINARLESRMGSVNSSGYKKAVLFGSMPEQLAKLITELSPDYLVFGRHETVHARPFSIGKMPYHSMLTYDIPVIVVPNTAEPT